MDENQFVGSDVLLHAKDSDRSERVIFPITRYDNILSSPKMVSDVETSYGAPFLLLQTDEVEIDEDELYNLCGAIF